MSVVMATADSKFPPLCQILKFLFYNLCCCSEDRRRIQTSVTTAFGTLQIMVGLIHIGLGPGRTSTSPGDLSSLGAAYWLGSVFIVAGIMSIVAGQFPSTCLMGFTVFMNISGAIFAITGIVLYAIDLGNSSLLWVCERSTASTDDHLRDNCMNVALFAQRLLTSMDTTLIAVTVLQLIVNIRYTILGIAALTSSLEEEEGGKDVEDQQEVVLTSPADSNQYN